MKKLTGRRQRFCEEYIIDLNCEQAMIRAGYALTYAHHYNTKILDSMGVKAEIERLLADRRLTKHYGREQAEDELDQAWQIAVAKRDSQAMTAATREKCKLFGLYPTEQGQQQGLVINIGKATKRPVESSEVAERPIGHIPPGPSVQDSTE